MSARRTEPVDLAVETAAHGAGIARVLDRAFGPGRFVKTSELIRARCCRPRPDLSPVAMEDGGVIGVCRIYDLGLRGACGYFLGPLAVDPLAQGRGLGERLIAAAVAAARRDAQAGGGAAIFLIGAPGLFAPFGFVEAPQPRFSCPWPVAPHRLRWLPLGPRAEALAGAFTAPPAASPA